MRNLTVGGIVLLMSAAPAFANALSPKDIQDKFFNGQPFTASTPASVKFKMVFTTDGKMTREPIGKAGAKSDGSWKLSKDGFCTSWKGAASNCYRLVAAGDNKWSVMKGSTSVGTWSR